MILAIERIDVKNRAFIIMMPEIIFKTYAIGVLRFL
jgi:hypothetical protein